MSDIFGAINDLQKLGSSLSWLVNWAKREWARRRDTDSTLFSINDFLAFNESVFNDCPNFRIGFYTLILLRKDIAIRKRSKIEICVGRLAELEL